MQTAENENIFTEAANKSFAELEHDFYLFLKTID